MRFVCAAIVPILLSGCTATYEQKPLAEQSIKMLRGKSVAIATSENGFYDKTEYQSSGKMTSLAVKAAFARYANRISVLPNCRDLACAKSVKGPAYDYYIIPEILHWEDRATEWSGIPDKIEVKISIYDAADDNELASTIIAGKSKWVSFGGDHPQDLLPEPLAAYVAALY